MVRFSSSASSIGASRFLGLLGSDTSRALIENRCHLLEFGNTLDKLVGMVEIVVTGMAKALMPKETFSLSTDDRHWSGRLYVLVERELVELETRRKVPEVLTELGRQRFLVGIDRVQSSFVAGINKGGILKTGGCTRRRGRIKRKEERCSITFSRDQNSMNQDI